MITRVNQAHSLWVSKSSLRQAMQRWSWANVWETRARCSIAWMRTKLEVTQKGPEYLSKPSSDFPSQSEENLNPLSPQLLFLISRGATLPKFFKTKDLPHLRAIGPFPVSSRLALSQLINRIKHHFLRPLATSPKLAFPSYFPMLSYISFP